MSSICDRKPDLPKFEKVEYTVDLNDERREIAGEGKRQFCAIVIRRCDTRDNSPYCQPPTMQKSALCPVTAISYPAESYKSAHNLILLAEKVALQEYASAPSKSVKEKIMKARVVGGFLIELYRRRAILGDTPATKVVEAVLSGSRPSHDVVYALGGLYRDCLIRGFRTVREKYPPPSTHPSRPSFDKLEDMIITAMDGSGKDYTTARKKCLARDGYKCMITGCYNTSSVSNNAELERLSDQSRRGIDMVQTCHILNDCTMQDINPSETNEETVQNNIRNSTGMMTILCQFGLKSLVDDLIKPNGIHDLRNLLSLRVSLHDQFDRLNLWFEATDEPNKYNVCVVKEAILESFKYINRQPHFAVFDPLMQRFKGPNIPLPDPRLLSLHAACARVAHMSGAAEFLDKLDREAEETKVLAKDGSNADLLANRLAPYSSSFIEVY